MRNTNIGIGNPKSVQMRRQCFGHRVVYFNDGRVYLDTTLSSGCVTATKNYLSVLGDEGSNSKK